MYIYLNYQLHIGMKIHFGVSTVLVALFTTYTATAQVTLGGQLRTRAEFRNGTGTLRPTNNDPAFFLSQRTRLSFGYKQSRVIFHTTLQDVRVWGQDASTISTADGAKLGVHEAWAEVILTNEKDGAPQKSAIEYFSIKTGRQELNYDDGRLLGNHDWAQQARRHDVLVFKLLNKGWQADAGFAFNRNTDAFNYNGNYYTPANIPPTLKDSKGFLVASPAGYLPLVDNTGFSSKTGSPAVVNPASTNRQMLIYKSLQYLYIAKSTGETKISGLLLADQFGKSKLDSVQTSSVNNLPGYVYGYHYNQKGVYGRVTTGLFLNSKSGKKKNTTITGGVYYQGGKDLNGNKLSALMAYGNVDFGVNKFTLSAGIDYLSGNDAVTPSSTNHRFDPLYGSPHESWGYMDFFYSSTGSAPGGLLNPHFKIQYSSENKRLVLALKYHYFTLADKMKDNSNNVLPSSLGTEVDAVLIYSLNKITTLEWGGSLLFANKTMEYAKGISPGTSKLNGQWTFLQLTIKPEFILK